MTIVEDVEEIRTPSQARTEARTEMEVAADVLARLIHRRALRGDEEALKLIAHVTGVPARAVIAALEFQKKSSVFRPPSSARCGTGDETLSVVAASPEAETRHAAQRKTTKYKAKNPTPDTRICSDCGRELPKSDFPVKQFNKDGTQVLRGRCTECRTKYNQHRYLSVKAERTLGALIQFVLVEEDDLASMGCPFCPAPLEAGQEVAGQVRLAHAACLHAQLDAAPA